MPGNKKRSYSIKLSPFEKKTKLASAAHMILMKHSKPSDDAVNSKNDKNHNNKSHINASSGTTVNNHVDKGIDNHQFDDKVSKIHYVCDGDDD